MFEEISSLSISQELIEMGLKDQEMRVGHQTDRKEKFDDKIASRLSGL